MPSPSFGTNFGYGSNGPYGGFNANWAPGSNGAIVPYSPGATSGGGSGGGSPVNIDNEVENFNTIEAGAKKYGQLGTKLTQDVAKYNNWISAAETIEKTAKKGIDAAKSMSG